MTTASAVTELSPSIYDIAAVALVDGPQQQACLNWLAEHRTTATSWGAAPEVNWYDSYLSTYAAAVAMRAAEQPELASDATNALPALVSKDAAEALETLTFGGLVQVLDRYCAHRGWQPVQHPIAVRAVVEREDDKWHTMRNWPHFLDPAVSIAGYCAERVYADTGVELGPFLAAFQAPNGSVSNAPGASAFFLLECERRAGPVPPDRLVRLRNYLHALQPQRIGYLDHVPHFVTSWRAMIEHELGGVPDIAPAAVDALCADLAHPSGLMGSVGSPMPEGTATIPGDADDTACAMLAARYLGRTPPPSTKLDELYDPDQGCYRTFLFEHDPSLTTNIHAAAALALDDRADRLTEVLQWITDTAIGRGRTSCKWHISPLYGLGELARVAAAISHPLALALHRHACTQLLAAQNSDGGWGAHGSTTEETGYAVLGIAAGAEPNSTEAESITAPLLRAHRYLAAHPAEGVPLWLGKTLYCVQPLVPVLHRTAMARIEQVATTLATTFGKDAS